MEFSFASCSLQYTPCFGNGAVEQAGERVSKDDVQLKESFDKEYEEKETNYLSGAVQQMAPHRSWKIFF